MRLRDGAGDVASARFPLTDVIDTIGRPKPALASDQAWSSLRRVTDTLPAALTNRLYLECRLATDAPVDIVMCVDERNREALTHGNGRALPGQMRAHPVWQGVLQLFGRWSSIASEVNRSVTQVWLEFDVSPAASDAGLVPVPGVFLAFPGSCARRAVREATLASFAFLRGAPFGLQAADAIDHAIACLPSPAQVAYAGLMCSRNLDTVRLCISGLGRDAVLGYLRDIDWPGSSSGLVDALRPLGCPSVPNPLESVALLHVDVGPSTGPRVGMEVCFSRRFQLAAITRERDFLDRLCDLELSTVGRRDAMLEWPGHSLRRFPHEICPSLVVRRLNAVKLVYVPEQPLEAKVYLTAFHAIRQRRT